MVLTACASSKMLTSEQEENVKKALGGGLKDLETTYPGIKFTDSIKNDKDEWSYISVGTVESGGVKTIITSTYRFAKDGENYKWWVTSSTKVGDATATEIKLIDGQTMTKAVYEGLVNDGKAPSTTA